MLIAKKNRHAIYEFLFKEGVMVAKKDYHALKHPDLETIPNLEVIKTMQVFVLFFFYFMNLYPNVSCYHVALCITIHK